jgi:hypothetical protein
VTDLSIASIPETIQPDIVLFLEDKKYFIDVSVTCPSAKSYRSAASNCNLSAAQLRANYKNSKESTACKLAGGEFIPFVVESYGAIHDEAEELLRLISKQYDSSREQNDFLAHARRRIAFAIQKGNGKIALEGLENLHRAALYPPHRQDDLPIPSEQIQSAVQQGNVVEVVQHSRLTVSPPRQPRGPDPRSPHHFCSPSSQISRNAIGSSMSIHSISSSQPSPQFLYTNNIANQTKIQISTSQVSSRQLGDAVEIARNSSAEISLNNTSPSSVASSECSAVLSTANASALNTSSSKRSAAIANASEKNSSSLAPTPVAPFDSEIICNDQKEMKENPPPSPVASLSSSQPATQPASSQELIDMNNENANQIANRIRNRDFISSIQSRRALRYPSP